MEREWNVYWRGERRDRRLEYILAETSHEKIYLSQLALHFFTYPHENRIVLCSTYHPLLSWNTWLKEVGPYRWAKICFESNVSMFQETGRAAASGTAQAETSKASATSAIHIGLWQLLSYALDEKKFAFGPIRISNCSSFWAKHFLTHSVVDKLYPFNTFFAIRRHFLQ